MPNPVEAEIRSRVESFTADIVALVRASALEVMNEALGGGKGPHRSRRGAPATGAAPRSSRPKGAKRDPKVLEALTEQLGAFIKKSPGKRIEEIGKALGTPTKDLALPVKKLLGAKKISTKGEKRATKYFPK